MLLPIRNYIYYHGSNYLFDNFITPSRGGPIRKGEERRKVNLDKVFFTLDLEYAKIHGKYIYVIRVSSDDLIVLNEKQGSTVFCSSIESLELLLMFPKSEIIK